MIMFVWISSRSNIALFFFKVKTINFIIALTKFFKYDVFLDAS